MAMASAYPAQLTPPTYTLTMQKHDSDVSVTLLIIVHRSILLGTFNHSKKLLKPLSMSWTIYGSAYLEIMMRKIRSVVTKCDLGMIAPLVWCFDTYPILSIFVLLIVLAYAVPICFFLIFAIVTFIITFSGFLFLEGAIIAVAFILLLSVLSTLTIVLGLFIFTCWILYMVVAQLFQTLPISSYSSIPLDERFTNNNPLNGSAFRVNEE